jgi:hypothetical protein
VIRPRAARPGAFYVCAKRCNQCLFSSAKIVSDERRADLLAGCAAEDRHFVCHKATIAGHEQDVCCRGFFDEMDGVGQLRRIAERLGVVRFVDPATLEEPTR